MKKKINQGIKFFFFSIFVSCFFIEALFVLSPNHLFLIIFSINEGKLKMLRFSSFEQFSYTPFATLFNVSSPTRSQVLNVADFWPPIIVPVNVSISSIERSISLMILNKLAIPAMPIRLAINAGVSLHRTVFSQKFSHSSSKNLLNQDLFLRRNNF